jgi:hypothetical protein
MGWTMTSAPGGGVSDAGGGAFALLDVPHCERHRRTARGEDMRSLEPEAGVRAADRAAVLADLTISAFEGALVLSRADRGIQPFNTTIDALTSAIDLDTASQPTAP